MNDMILWEYLEELPELEAAWNDWSRRLSGWLNFNTLYTNYLMVQNKRIQYLKCTIECEHCCPRQVIDDSPTNIKAVCPEKKVEPVKLTFKDTLIYALRRESFHQAICRTLNIEYSADRWNELKKIWHLGDSSGVLAVGLHDRQHAPGQGEFQVKGGSEFGRREGLEAEGQRPAGQQVGASAAQLAGGGATQGETPLA